MNNNTYTKTSFSLILDNCSEGILVVNDQGIVEYANKSARNLFQYEILVGVNVIELIPERFRKKHRIIMTSYFEYPSNRKMGKGMNLFGIKGDGVEIPLEIGINYIEEDGNKKVILSLVDVSERVDYEKKLKEYYDSLQYSLKELQYQKKLLYESEEKYRSIVSNLDDIYYRTDNNQNVVFISPSALNYTNEKSIEEIIGQNIVDKFYYNKEDRTELLKTMHANNGTINNYEIILKCKGGVPGTFSTNSHFLYDEDGEICGVEGILRDVTEKKILEQKQEENSKKIAIAYENITDSINYASTIQKSMLAKPEEVSKILGSHFIFYKPKDRIGGDFYTVDQVDNIKYFAVGDCTGHGVPGALISILAINSLHSIEAENSKPSDILEKLRLKIKSAFKSESKNDTGVDIALCSYNPETMELQYSGAFSPLLIVRNGELIIHEATRNPVGKYLIEKEFKNTVIQMHEGDKVYLFSDGYQDQFSAENDKRLGRVPFYNFLLETSKKTMEEQGSLIESFFYCRKKDTDQTDDVTVMGIQF